MSDDMRRIRRQIRGRDAHEARAAMLSMGTQVAAGMETRLRNIPGYFGIGRRRIDIQVEEQFSDAWFAMALLLTLTGLIFRVNALLTIAVLLVTIVAVSWVWNRLAFFGLLYGRTFSLRRAFVGETVGLKIEAANHKFLPLSWIRIADVFPTDLPLVEGAIIERRDTNQGELDTFWALRSYEKATRTFLINATRRGYYHFGPTRLETGDLFGLFRSTRRLQNEQVLVVYPKVLPLVALGLPAKEPFGDLRAPRFIFRRPYPHGGYP